MKRVKITKISAVNLMKNFPLVLAALFIAVPAGAGGQIYKNNVLTSQHVLITGTHVALSIPKGVSQSAGFRGFEIASRKIKLEVSEVAVPYPHSAASLTPPLIADATGIAVKETSDVTINNLPAKFMKGVISMDIPAGEGAEPGGGTETNLFGASLFVLGNDKLTIYITGTYPKNDSVAADIIRNVQLSAIIDPNKAEGGGGYTLSAEGTVFRFVDDVGGRRTYVLDESRAPRIDASSVGYSSGVQMRGIPEEERTGYAKKSMDGFLAGRESKSMSARQVNIGGLPGIELITDVGGFSHKRKTSSGGHINLVTPAKWYQTVLFDKDATYVFSGFVINNVDTFLPQFIGITSTFRKTQ
ncbi:hypothetical protein FACS1894216_13980 [Synergistales bacterium]|nr:hypothetical protein FACS1894216_13980 [Synergistales bacterium]